MAAPGRAYLQRFADEIAEGDAMDDLDADARMRYAATILMVTLATDSDGGVTPDAMDEVVEWVGQACYGWVD